MSENIPASASAGASSAPADTTPAAAGASNAPAVASGEALHRGLANRHIQLIALGGAIGTGLFYGSADSIGLAGPAILLSYLVGGAIIYMVMRALGEMSVHRPVAGAFSDYAYRYWSPLAGFISGWNYWFNYIFVAMAELSVVGIYVQFWFPSAPAWLTAAFCLVFITAINLLGVRAFGEFEFWFALIKVVAIIGMIVLGILLLVVGMQEPHPAPTTGFLHAFFPNGAAGVIMSFVVVMFSFGGVELIGITAGEAEEPRKSIPHAIRLVIQRILIFYILSLAVIMAVIPWKSIDGKASPFVQIFTGAGIPVAAHILNFVVLTAALSVYNSGLYSNGRMLYALAEQGNAPKFFHHTSRHGVPYRGVLVSSAITVIAVVVVFLFPDFAFKYLMSIALIAGIINWSMVLITQMLFRRHLSASEVDELEFKLPGGTVTSVLTLIALAAIVVIMATMPQYRIAVIVGPVWIAVLLVAYFIKKSAHREAVAA